MRQFEGYGKGINLGGWLSQCGEGNYTEERYSTFITEPDVERIASMGFDHIRMPVDYNVILHDDGSADDQGFSHIEDCIGWCRKRGLNLIFDIHKAKGFIFDDEDDVALFSDPALMDGFVAMWDLISKRYSSEKDMLTFELMNEVTEEKFSDTWNGLAARAIKAIRANDSDVRIIVGGIFNNSLYGVTLLDPPADDNIIYTFHCYSPLLFTHQGAYWIKGMPLDYRVEYPGKTDFYREESKKFFSDRIDSIFENKEEMIGPDYFRQLFAQAIDAAKKYDVPLYCGEYGVIDKADPASTARWFTDIHQVLNENKIGHAIWSYKQMDLGITDKHYEEALPQILKTM